MNLEGEDERNVKPQLQRSYAAGYQDKIDSLHKSVTLALHLDEIISQKEAII
jgi:hypothetical protein